jgi:hypothetical protein
VMFSSRNMECKVNGKYKDLRSSTSGNKIKYAGVNF